MKLKHLPLCILLLIPSLYAEQPRYVGTLASFQNQVCNPAAGDMAFATDATAGANLYLCTAKDIWTQVTGGTGAVTNSGTLTADLPVFGNGTTIVKVGTKTGTGNVAVMQASPTLTTPTIASFANATHTHANAAGGGAIPATSIPKIPV